MDFVSPVEIVQALKERADHGVFGYTLSDDEVGQAVTGWLFDRFGWKVQQDWLMIFPESSVPCIWLCPL
jgi:cystathionine beta-lyase